MTLTTRAASEGGTNPRPGWMCGEIRLTSSGCSGWTSGKLADMTRFETGSFQVLLSPVAVVLLVVALTPLTVWPVRRRG